MPARLDETSRFADWKSALPLIFSQLQGIVRENTKTPTLERRLKLEVAVPIDIFDTCRPGNSHLLPDASKVGRNLLGIITDAYCEFCLPIPSLEDVARAAWNIVD